MALTCQDQTKLRKKSPLNGQTGQPETLNKRNKIHYTKFPRCAESRRRVRAVSSPSAAFTVSLRH